MSLDFAAVLSRMVELNASDVHLSPGFAPAVRVRGAITPLDDYPELTPQDTREIVYSLLNDAQRKRFENEQAARLRLLDPGRRAVQGQRLLPARRDQRRLPPDPDRDHQPRGARACRA